MLPDPLAPARFVGAFLPWKQKKLEITSSPARRLRTSSAMCCCAQAASQLRTDKLLRTKNSRRYVSTAVSFTVHRMLG